VPAPGRVTGSPRSAVVMRRAGGAAGLPVREVALDNGGDVLGGHAVQVQVDLGRPHAQAVQERAGGPAGHMAVFCNAAPGCRSVWYRPRHEQLAAPT
jgi:hypothetical protein